MTFTEPAHVGVTGQHLGERSVLALIRYPVARGPSGSCPSGGPFPLLMFAPGFQQCSDTFEHLLQSWASAAMWWRRWTSRAPTAWSVRPRTSRTW